MKNNRGKRRFIRPTHANAKHAIYKELRASLKIQNVKLE